MKAFADEARSLMQAIGRPVRLMEVCGTHTVAIFRAGLRSLFPEGLHLLSGPGCPVCVTPVAYVDQAIALAETGAGIATFGDLVRVPGSRQSLEQARAEGGNIKVVYSPLDALAWAAENPQTPVVFLGVGFETTAPSVAITLQAAQARRVHNFRVLSGHKTVPRAMAALLGLGEIKIDGFLCPGHVSVIVGTRPYEFIPRQHGVPCAISGFEPLDIGRAILALLRQIAEKRAEVENHYPRSVKPEGNPSALAALETVFQDCDAAWRGIGGIPATGLAIRREYSDWDAAPLVPPALPEPLEPQGCICGEVLRGVKTPLECPLFRKSCSPSRPVGACMVSSEGTCAAYYKYHPGQTPRSSHGQ